MIIMNFCRLVDIYEYYDGIECRIPIRPIGREMRNLQHFHNFRNGKTRSLIPPELGNTIEYVELDFDETSQMVFTMAE